MKRSRLLLALLLVWAPGTVRAQTPDVDRAQALVAEGRYDQARTVLADWWRRVDDEGAEAPDDVLARGRLLRARLAPDLRSARSDYLTLVLEHPHSPHAAEALLRLGQGFLLAGNIDRAVSYLERLRTDYPGSRYRPTGLLWLARAYRAAGRRTQGCALATRLRQDPSVGAELRTLARHEADTLCPRDQARPEVAAAEAEPTREEPAPDSADADAPAGPLTIQTGAFRREQGAASMAARLRAAGFEPRIVYVPGSSLLRVRVGRFSDSARARDLLRRVRAAGFTAVIVRDADAERPR